jgi:hypothetical protein
MLFGKPLNFYAPLRTILMLIIITNIEFSGSSSGKQTSFLFIYLPVKEMPSTD